MKIEDLFTRPHAETSRPMEVLTVEGQKTGVFMQVLGSESTTFIQARREYTRRRLLDKPDNEDAVLSSEYEYAKLVSKLVVSWDFDEECTEENKVKLFYETPYLASMVETFASTSGNKVHEAKQDSSTGQKKASD